MREIDIDEALDLLEAIVEAKGPDYVYEKVSPNSGRCFNFHTVEGSTPVPGCIIGHLFASLGLTYEYVNEQNLNGSSVRDVHYRMIDDGFGDFRFTEPALLALGKAQSMQDDGETWGEALVSARAYAEYLKPKILVVG